MVNRTLKPIQIPLPIEGETYQIELTQGQVTIVDVIDADLASNLWRAQKDGVGEFRAVRTVRVHGRSSLIFLHQVILERILGRKLNQGEIVDHDDGNPLNNTRSNLRVATHTQNMQNRKINKNNTSGFKGVIPWRKKWRATIWANGIRHHLGTFKSAEEASEAYGIASENLHGEFGRMR